MTWFPSVPWLDIYLCGLYATTALQCAFVLVFLTTSWRRYRTGRALFTKSAVLALMLTLTLAAWYGMPHVLEIGTVLMWVMAGAVAYLLWSVVSQKVLDRRARRRT